MNDNRIRILLAELLLVTALVACADTKTANDANFTAAIDDYLASGGHGALCLGLDVSFPHEAGPEDAAGDTNEKLTELREAKVIEAQMATVHAYPQWRDLTDPWVRSMRDEMKTVMTYTLTRAGSTYVTTNQSVGFGGSSRFCFAHLQGAKIVRFTEPGVMNGITVSDVTWVPEVTKMDAWASRALEAKQLPTIKHLIDETETAERHNLLELTDKGWEAVD
jgi:hypothetical protein